MARFFTLAQAESLLHSLEPMVRQAVDAKQALDKATTELNHYTQRMMMSGGMLVNREAVLAIKARQQNAAVQLKELLEEIQNSGAQVKDLDTGLLDFPTRYGGEEVNLCWRLGESRIEYWHDMTEGFRGRKPIDQHFLDNHRGDMVS